MQSNRYFFIAIIIGAIIIAASIIYVNRPPNIEVQDNEESTQTVDKPELIPEPEPEPTPVSAQSTVKTLVQEYLSETGPQILKTEKENIEVIIKDYPIEPQPASEAITVRATEGEEIEYTLDIKTQDWAYASVGIENTFLGGFVDGQEDKLNLGLYSFLQAAALNIDEPEHLSNVAFHLNNKGDYENAKILLQYALTLDENYFPALSNLAYAYTGLGDYTEAILVQLKVVSLRPEKWCLLRLADYYDKAGMFDASGAIKTAFEASEEVSIPPTPPILTLSSNGESVMAEIEKLVLSLDAKNQAILDSLDPRLDDIFDKFGNDFLDIWDRALGGCAMPLLLSDEDADACATCIIPAYIESTNLVSSIYAETLPLIQSYESKAFQELEKHTRQAVETVEDADLDESEREALLKEIQRRYTIKYTRIIMDPRIGLKLFLAWNRLVRARACHPVFYYVWKTPIFLQKFRQ
jgi:tetratricopeptide (TPR) repeat protein